MKKYRIKYTKGDKVKFIAHLDMLKVFSRAAIRAELPVTYSDGFNPHPDFVFGMPIPVGVASEAEYVDTSLTEDLPEEEVLKRFNDVMPDGIVLTECREILPGTPNIMSAVKASSYSVKISFGTGAEADSFKLFEKIYNIFLEKEPLVVSKRSKRGMHDVDIMPMIFDIRFESEEKGICNIFIVTAAGNDATLRPELAFEGLCGKAGIEFEIFGIHRIALL